MSHSQSVSLSTRIIQWKREFEATVYGQLDRLKRNCSEKSSAAQLGQSRIQTKRCDGNAHTIYSSYLPLLGIFIFAHWKRWQWRRREWCARCSKCVFSNFVGLCALMRCFKWDKKTQSKQQHHSFTRVFGWICVCVVPFLSSTARFVIYSWNEFHSRLVFFPPCSVSFRVSKQRVGCKKTATMSSCSWM